MKTSKGWFIFSYIIGMMYFIMYILWKENNSEALFANGYLMILSHFCTFVALAICGNRVVRRQIIWKTFTIFVALLGVFIFWTPCIMSLVLSVLFTSASSRSRICSATSKKPKVLKMRASSQTSSGNTSSGLEYLLPLYSSVTGKSRTKLLRSLLQGSVFLLNNFVFIN